MGRSKQSFDSLEIVTTKEVLKRLKIGRTKLFELKRSGTLVPGRHFIKNGRVLRFIWGADLIETIHEKSVGDAAVSSKGPNKFKTNTAHSTIKSTINLNY